MDNIFINTITDKEEIHAIESAIHKGSFPMAVYGLSESPKAHISYLIHNIACKNSLIITYNQNQASKLYQDLSFFLKDRVIMFPSREVVFHNIDAQSNEAVYQRLSVIEKLCKTQGLMVITTVDSIMTPMVPLDIYKDKSIDLSLGQSCDIDSLLSTLINMGYARVDMLEGKGQFALRGDILDIFPATMENAFRIEFFGDEVDSIRRLDILTQRSDEKQSSISIFAAREIILDEERLKQGCQRMEQSLKEYKSSHGGAKYKSVIQNLSNRIGEDIDKVMSQGSINTIYNYLSFFYPRLQSFLDYFEDEDMIFIDEIPKIRERVEDFRENFDLSFSEYFERGEVLPQQKSLVLEYHQVIDSISFKRAVLYSVFLKNDRDLRPKSIINFEARIMQPFHGKIELLIEELKLIKQKNHRCIILVNTKDKALRLRDLLKSRSMEVLMVSNDDQLSQGQIGLMIGALSKGFEYPSLKLSVITDQDVYGLRPSIKSKNIKKPKDKDRIKLFSDLKLEDYVVHESHGIGQYVGIEQLRVQGVKKDYLNIRYAGNDKLYIPTEQVHLIQKYIGSEGKGPKLSKLGGTEWAKTKQKVQKAIKEMAIDLVKLYAIRESTPGYGFSKDTQWQAQFEESFPYQETDDQLRCIKEIKADMERTRPMDRLLCGDVGYGKTEVAIRSAFKAVMDGKQVAVLVPTTILAQQHYNTFVQRFSDFPVTIDMLSRFRTDQEQRNTLEKVKQGDVDILIGTHRILSKDIAYKDLGLLIVDEEQRFGVNHKETIKQIRRNVDVLTLSATPIPRTLHMSLSGIRDMSVIEEPPEERYPIQTYVVEYSESIIKDAITREVNRKGQVYFVFNRVNGIYKMASRLKELLPNVNIGVAHGQMNETQLEKVMMDFLEGEIDVLVCTTIIETGMDISNVNTIIIHDSDKLGLSQLYQLRGRVGRSNRVAYAYLTYQRDKVLSEVAEKRLKAIKEFTEFGSGFKIAMRDLEIRGAGNLLGAEQHGQMASVGYEMYCKLLDDEIKKVKGEPLREEVNTTVEINIDAYIPSDYIPVEIQKIEIYKKIASITSKDEYMEVYEEIEDRYGDLPVTIINLLDISYIRSLASKSGIITMSDGEEGYKIVFAHSSFIPIDRMKDILEVYPRMITLGGTNRPYMLFKPRDKNKTKSVEQLKNLIEKISGFIVK
jgi:transcription-repair coupling factor (superfamily II helicase)